MNWIATLTLLVGAAVGYVVGATRAHIANERHMRDLNRWIDHYAPGARPPLADDE